MKIIKKINNKFHLSLKKYIERYTGAAVTTEMIKHSYFNNNLPLTNSNSKRNELVVSLTTFGKRIHTVFMTLESIAQQTMKPDKVILWLAEDEFSPEKIPESLKIFEKRGLSIEYCRDIKSYKKLLFTLKKYPNSNIITIDDDMIYPVDMIAQMFDTYTKYPDSVCCNVAMEIGVNDNRDVLPYNQWKHITLESGPSKRAMPIGVNGILYPSDCFDDTVLDITKILSLAPKADDIWFKLMALKNNTKTVVTGAYPNFLNSFVYIDSSFIDSLATTNIHELENDKQLRAIMDEYKIAI